MHPAPLAVPDQAGTAPPVGGIADVLAGLHEAGQALARAETLDQIARLGADLTLGLVPAACRAELRITRDARPSICASASRAGRRRRSTASAPGILCVPIKAETRLSRATIIGALTVFTDTTAGLDQIAAQTAAILAGQIQAALTSAAANEHAGQLQTALASSRTIGTAIGILMVTRDLTSEQAFQLLRTLSQNTNRTLALVTRHMVRAHPATGTRQPRQALATPDTGRWRPLT